jgi:hypothetical protein
MFMKKFILVLLAQEYGNPVDCLPRDSGISPLSIFY